MSKKSINTGNIMLYIIKEKSRGSKITTSTLFTRLQQAFKLKNSPFSAPLTNLLSQN